jgi:hypothetical protein
MNKTSSIASMLVVGLAGAAEAGGQAGSLGLGAEFQLNGAGGVSLNSDNGDFHVGGFVGFSDTGRDNDDTVFTVGGRFFYHVHSTAMSDFGIGGNVGVVSLPEPAMSNDGRELELYIEPAFQIRVFVASNVALSGTGGVVIGVVDAEDVAITGSAVGGGRATLSAAGVSLGGGVGLHYYFF